jgi:ribosome-interacting GTPase 1
LEAAAASVHKDFAAKMKYAHLWGSGKHDGIMVKRDYILQEGDIIELHL